MSRVLIVDDEPAIVRLLTGIATRGGHDVETAASGRAAIKIAARGRIDAVLLDMGLPDLDGIEVIAAIRVHSNVPIIIVTARGDVSEKVTALDLGADDYITKPFDGDELLARLRSALRRGAGRPVDDPILRHGVIAIDPERREVTVRDEAVTLTPKEFAVLELLVAAGGRVLTHRHILQAVWGPAHHDDIEYLRVVIRALRLKIEVDPSRPALIRNEPAIGYRII